MNDKALEYKETLEFIRKCKRVKCANCVRMVDSVLPPAASDWEKGE